ncbi:DUF547 domain-containing protein [Hyphobacterium sp. HN65]|uniref:DUF547 domain-containing protein n=1 Tax=Hyphobacterium lacteum TaxID=3116575 RepID=A0ABU7LR67_9PROT|nr:DUF547 domain-containing protein [Hyphobacterium sp. HN65]MEE2526401.1 DUF547 domain-containing protein [Hyphobacterium sp. HN65]
MIKLIQVFGLASALALAGQAVAQTEADNRFERFAPSTTDYGRSHVDYSTWTMMLSEIVLNVGYSDRRSPRRDVGATGTRVFTGNTSRFRFEANRVIYHLVEDFHLDAITQYRQELEQVPEQLNFARLSPDEQLAYWLNLYTVATIEQVGLVYPQNDMERTRAANSELHYLDAPVVTVMGQPLSLNDIQYNIVYRFWDDPRVIYGFFNGTIGAPRVMREAYDASRVWSQLESNGREFVNSLRGVDNSPRSLIISRHYERARDTFFPNWPEDVRDHLSAFAGEDVMELIDSDIPVRPTSDEWGIADMTNGSNRCGGSISQTVSTGRGGTGSGRDAMFCGGLPDNARILLDFVVERRIRQFRDGSLGNVYVRDLPDQNIVIDMSEDDDENTEEETDGEISN